MDETMEKQMEDQDLDQSEEQFFEENPLPEDCEARRIILSMVSLSGVMTLRRQSMDLIERVEGELTEEMKKEREEICAMPPEKLGDMLRKLRYRENLVELSFRITENQEQAMPLILRRYLTSGYENYINRTIDIFYIADLIYTEELFRLVDQIRNPIARSRACILFGMRLNDVNEFLFEEYQKNMYTDFAEGPLAGLHCWTGRLNDWVKMRMSQIVQENN